MHLVEVETPPGCRWVGVVDGDRVYAVNGVAGMRELAFGAIRAGNDLAAEINRLGTVVGPDSLNELLAAGRVLAPLDHVDPAHCLIFGTGLTHTGSAAARDSMHLGGADDDAEAGLSDSMKMFRWRVHGGRPESGQAGVQPEWFYKGDGNIVYRPGAALPAPAFGADLGEEPEIAGLYVIGDDAKPYRLGYALGNEVSDHVTERQNYLYLAHSKLRACAFGPTLLTGELPAEIVGTSRIWRDDSVLWEKPFLSGEAYMCHSLENLEYHHFKYAQFLRPGDVHIHFFGTATLSFADGISTQPGDTFEIVAPPFGPALTNIVGSAEPGLAPGRVNAL